MRSSKSGFFTVFCITFSNSYATGGSKTLQYHKLNVALGHCSSPVLKFYSLLAEGITSSAHLMDDQTWFGCFTIMNIIKHLKEQEHSSCIKWCPASICNACRPERLPDIRCKFQGYNFRLGDEGESYCIWGMYHVNDNLYFDQLIMFDGWKCLLSVSLHRWCPWCRDTSSGALL